MTAWKSQQPEPARFPSYRVVDEAGNLVATVPIMADNKALERLAIITAAPEMLQVLREAEQFAGLPHMEDDALQMCIDRGLDHEKGLGKGKAAFTLRVRAIIRKAEGKS